MMIPCKECGQMKSDQSGRCPHCGARHDYGGYGWAMVIACAVAAAAYVFQCVKP